MVNWLVLGQGEERLRTWIVTVVMTTDLVSYKMRPAQLFQEAAQQVRRMILKEKKL
jgi:hypothetical protein